MGGGGTRFANTPLTSKEVRDFEREIKGLLEEPISTAEQLDQLLGLNIFYLGRDAISNENNIFPRGKADD